MEYQHFQMIFKAKELKQIMTYLVGFRTPIYMTSIYECSTTGSPCETKCLIWMCMDTGSALARHTGQEESEAIRHVAQKLAVLLAKGNAALLLNRVPTYPSTDTDGQD